MTYINMKRIFAFILLAIIVSPCILIFNESDHIWVNFVGLCYLLGLVLIGKTKVGKKIFKMLDKTIGLSCDNDKDFY